MFNPHILSQQGIDRSDAIKQITEGMPELVRQAEAAVLVKNSGLLPLPNGCRVSSFSRIQYDYFCVGYGSGGDVNRQYQINLMEGITECDRLKPIDHGDWGTWPFYYAEMPLEKS